MTVSTHTALIVFTLLLCPSCNEKKHPLTKEGEIILRLVHDKSQSENYRKSAGILFNVLQEKENIIIRDFLNTDRELSSVRSLAAAQAWIAFMEATEKKFPDTLPSAEEMDKEEKRNNKNKITMLYYSTMIRLQLINSCISALTYLDMPESKSALDSFFQRFEKKYGGFSGGKKILESYRLERSQHEESLRKRIAPWQIAPWQIGPWQSGPWQSGPYPSDGVS